MRLIFIGSGSAFTIGDDNWQSNMLLESDSGRRLLLDCGSDARFALAECGVGSDEVDAVYISHLHADHVGGLEWLAFSTFFSLRPRRPLLFIDGALSDSLWEHTLAGGMGRCGTATLDTYFEVERIGTSRSFVWEGQLFELVTMIHCVDGDTTLPSYGIRFVSGAGSHLITTDTRFEPERNRPLYEWADIIFHDCETSYIASGAPARSGVHAHYDDLKTLPPATREKMWLYHYQPGTVQEPIRDGFRGFVRKGQAFAV